MRRALPEPAKSVSVFPPPGAPASPKNGRAARRSTGVAIARQRTREASWPSAAAPKHCAWHRDHLDACCSELLVCLAVVLVRQDQPGGEGKHVDAVIPRAAV